MLGGRKRRRIQAATLALVTSAALSSWGPSQGSSASGPRIPEGQHASNGTVRFLMWTSVADCIGLGDAQLLEWKSRGAGGFVCGVGPLAGMGGKQEFAAAPESLAGAQYSLEQSLVTSKVVSALRRWA